MTTLLALDEFAGNARGVLGHNILDYDLPILARLRPDLRFLNKPVIDTLFLSPLAFPENPYHRLVKDYKLVRDTVNDPVADARLAASVFLDQWESFSRMAASGRGEVLSFYRFCFEGKAEPEAPSFEGTAAAFAAWGHPASAWTRPVSWLTNCFPRWSAGVPSRIICSPPLSIRR